MNGQNVTKFCIHIIIEDLRWYFKSSFFANLQQSYGPDVRIQFLFNILRMNGHNLTKFCVHIIIDKICVGIVKEIEKQ